MKKFFSLVLALVMALSLATVAWGAVQEVDTFDELKTAVANGGDIKLTGDIPDANEIILVGKDVTIDGDGYTITSEARRVFRLTTSDIEVVMEDLNIVSTADMVYPNDVRGISIDGLDNSNTPVTGVSLTLNNCSVDFTKPTAIDWTYAVNICDGGSGNTLTISGGSYEGANCINVWGEDHVITINGATLISTYPENPTYHGCGIRVEDNDGDDAVVEVTVTNTTFKGEHAVDFSLKGSETPVVASGNTNKMGLQLLANGEVAVNPASTAAGVAPILYAWDNAGAEWDAYFVATGDDLDDLKQDASDNCLPCYFIDGEYFLETTAAKATYKLVYGAKTVYLTPVAAKLVKYVDTASVLKVVEEIEAECGDFYVADANYDDDDVYYISYNKKGEVDGIWVKEKNGPVQLLVGSKIVDAKVATVVDFMDHDWEGYEVVNKAYVSVKCSECDKVAKLYANATAAGKKAVPVLDGTVWITYADANDFGAVAPSAPSTGKVESAQTFDAGIAMYVGMSVMAAAGSAVVIGKKKD